MRHVCLLDPFTSTYRSIRLWFIRRRVNRSLKVLDALDWNMQHAGWTRRDRRRFWREFIKKQEFRTDVFNELTQQ
uniref:Uncharacterized protein n=1 Tax=viral metagenome TaxID=1070528 RepID=A0A6M3JW69_9ZZZZ